MSHPTTCRADSAPAARPARPRARLALLLPGLALLFGCALRGPALPAIAAEPTLYHNVGRFVFFDLVTDDLASAEKFYSGLFGWSFERVHSGKDAYSLFRHRGAPIAGAARSVPEDGKERDARWIGSLSVADVDAAVKSVREANGSVLDEPFNVRGRGRMALVRDAEGALLVLLRSEYGDPPDAKPGVGSWAWMELWTRDPKAAVRFYAPLTGWREASVERGGERQRILKRGDRPRAGLVTIPWAEVEPNWLPYVLVADVEDSVKKAVELGGVVLLRDDSAAILEDPTGAAFTIYGLRAVAKEVEGR